jgi:uncharacterized repeat protein (TIGR02543 family)
MIIAKFDTDGNKIWLRTYGGGYADQFYSVTSASGGGYVAVGSSYSFADTGSDLAGNKGDSDMVIAKFDDSGNLSEIPWINDQTAPPAPTLATKSSESVTLGTLDGAEYSMNGSSWQSNPIFSGLSRDTAYTFYQRYKAKAGYHASPASPGLTVRTDNTSAVGTRPIPDNKPAGSETPSAPGTKFKISYNPNWGKLKITKSYKSKWKNYFSPKPVAKTVAFGKDYGSLPGIKKQPMGYKFAGWWTTASRGTQITTKSKVSTGRDATLYAHWVAKKSTVKFVNLKGKVVKKQTVAYGKKYGRLPKGTAKVKGWKFTGWYTKKKGGKKITANTVVTITEDITLYPYWRRA